MEKIYQGGSTITGRFRPNKVVSYKDTMTKAEKRTLLLFSCLIFATCLGLILFVASTVVSTKFSWLLLVAMLLVLLVELIRLLLSITVLVFAYFAKDPVPMAPQKNLRVAVLTTIVPGKEPFPLVAKTLREMKRIDPGPGNTLDVWLLDEGNGPDIKAACRAMGVHHFSRKGIAEWNTPSGPFRARTKHGNHNAWRSAHENSYDIVAQMDPDHIPRRNFLTRTLGYFTDPDVAFVVAPQVYGNLQDNWIANASACQSYIFHGIIQRGGNGLNAPLLIGTNHLYRVEAFRQINGYQDSIIEDHLTSMTIAGTVKADGSKWKGVYTPDLLAVGEGPTSFTDYFNQQKRWAYGIWEIVRLHTARATKTLSKRQALTHMMLQFFYPSLAVGWVLGSLITLLFSGLLANFQGLGPIFAVLWLYSFASSLGLFFWLRRFNLMPHERKDWCLEGMALTMMCIPVYVNAAWQALIRKPLSYAVTAKGNLASPDSLQTFTPHLQWMVYNVLLLEVFSVASMFGTSVRFSSIYWTIANIFVCALPIGIFAIARAKTFSPAKPLRRVFASARTLQAANN
jgi:cellulose synthase/poly-beta-1,6-N-acetylglucosamine synthase-like glycosyltransferase